MPELLESDAGHLAQGLHLVSPAAMAERLSKGQWRRARHLDYLSSKLVDVAAGDCKRLMILMPPRHGKSELTSHWFPTWLQALMPETRIIFASYAAEFAREWGRKVRNTVQSHWPELGVVVAEDSHAAHRWHTAEGGGMTTAGVGGEFTGRGAEILILDDPTKNAEDALSETVQLRNWQWWKSTFRTRLQPGGAIVVIGTPWDPGDLIGRLRKAQQDGPEAEGYEDWEIVNLPAVAIEEGDALGRAVDEPLWPEQYSSEELAALKRSVGSHWWRAQYQQQPTAIGGNIIKEHWWRYWKPAGVHLEPVVVNGIVCPLVDLPEELDVTIQSWDMNYRDAVRAIVKGEEPDPIAGLVISRKAADLFLRDRFHARVGLTATIEAVRTVSKNNPDAKTKLVEYTANGPAVIATLRHELGGFIPVTPRGSKVSRVMSAGATEQDKDARGVSMAAGVEGGNFYLPHPDLYPWVAEYRANLGKFPAKEGRDDTDATSQAWAHLTGPAWRKAEADAAAAARRGPAPTNLHELRAQQTQEVLQRELERANGSGAPNPRQRVAIYRRDRR